MTLVERERALYGDVWQTIDHYGCHSPGEQYLPIFLTHAQPYTQLPKCRITHTVLDAGCGSGRAGVALAAAGFDVTLCDLTDSGLIPEARQLPFIPACLWREIPRREPFRQRYHYVYCCDVLEHIPREYTMLVIDQLVRAACVGVFLSVSLVSDINGLWVGQPLHQTVESYVWWRDRVSEAAQLIDGRDMHTSATFFLRP